uniref:Uncharacterized protein n=1 Tax=Anguilla anguilla TaxID=7936 RepID=A0A0E9QCB3_ANGAN
MGRLVLSSLYQNVKPWNFWFYPLGCTGAPDLNQINATANSTTTPASAWPPWSEF